MKAAPGLNLSVAMAQMASHLGLGFKVKGLVLRVEGLRFTYWCLMEEWGAT